MDKQAETKASAERAEAQFPLLNGFNGQAMRLAVWPIELWLQWQADILKAAAPAAADWMTRRREGTAAALHALERLSACRDAKDASRIQSEWIEDETKRLETDMRALGGLSRLWSEESVKIMPVGAKGARETH